MVVLTNERDFAADLVIHHLLSEGVAVQRINIEQARSTATMHWDPNNESTDTLRVVWWRQFQADPQPLSLEQADDQLVERAQWRTWLATLNRPRVTWVNHLWAARRAEDKVEQLRTAKQVGFTIPRTVVTNDAATARAFRNQVGSAVIKTLSAGYFSLSNQAFVFTEALEDSILTREDHWHAVPLVVQERLHEALDARIVSFGERCFGAKCVSPGLDWRKTPFDASLWSHWDVPPSLARTCAAYRRELGLEFAAFDFMIRGEAVFFLEANQAGEWMFLDRALGIGIGKEIANFLRRLGEPT